MRDGERFWVLVGPYRCRRCKFFFFYVTFYVGEAERVQGCGEWGGAQGVVFSLVSPRVFVMLFEFEECGMFIVLLYLIMIILSRR